MESYLSLEAAVAATRMRLPDSLDTLPQLLNLYCIGATLDAYSLEKIFDRTREIWVWSRYVSGTQDDGTLSPHITAKAYELKWIIFKFGNSNKESSFTELDDKPTSTYPWLSWQPDRNDRSVMHMLAEEDNISVATFSSNLSEEKLNPNYAGAYPNTAVWAPNLESASTAVPTSLAASLVSGSEACGKPCGTRTTVLLGEAKSTANTPTKLWGLEALKDALVETEASAGGMLEGAALLQEHLYDSSGGGAAAVGALTDSTYVGTSSAIASSESSSSSNHDPESKIHGSNDSLFNAAIPAETYQEASAAAAAAMKVHESLSLLSASLDSL
jgi:hypothetical protein